MKVNFYESIDDCLLKYAVIISRYREKWVFCKHKDRSTYEIPGGHREENEQISETARRELHEETGAVKFSIVPVCVYSVTDKNSISADGNETFGMLYAAIIEEFEPELQYEIDKIDFFEELPSEWTYPLIQPMLIQEYQRRINTKDIPICKHSTT